MNLSDSLPPAPVSKFTPDKRVMNIGGPNYLVNARHGGFLANEHDYYLGYALIRYGEYGEHELHLLQQLIRPGALVVEAGANIGTHTVPLAKHVGPAGRVIAIEPQRIIHQHLCGNIAMNALANVETYHCGASDRTGIMSVPNVDYFARKRNNFGGVALQPEGNGEPVTLRAVDEIVGSRHAHLIKVDVEGMEAEVLRGAKKTIKRCRPFLYVENDRVDKSEELIKLLQHFGYRTFWHMPYLYNPLNYFELVENLYDGMRSINMFCIPNESVMDMRHFQEVRDPKEHPLHAFK